MREIEWGGRMFPSLAAAARSEGGTQSTMRLWLDLTPERAVAIPTPIRGVLFPSIAADARTVGVTRSTVERATRRGTLDRVGMVKRARQ